MDKLERFKTLADESSKPNPGWNKIVNNIKLNDMYEKAYKATNAALNNVYKSTMKLITPPTLENETEIQAKKAEEKAEKNNAFQENIKNQFLNMNSTAQVRFFDDEEELSKNKPSEEDYNPSGLKKYKTYEEMFERSGRVGFREDEELAKIANERSYKYGDTYEDAIKNWESKYKASQKTAKFTVTIPHGTYDEVLVCKYDKDTFEIIEQESRIDKYDNYKKGDEKGEEKGNFFKWLGNSALKGLGSFNVGVTETADILIGKPLQALGWENNPISAINKYYENVYEKFDRKADEEAEKLGGGKGYEVGGQIIEGTIAALPNAILALMTAGTSTTGTAASSASALSSKAAYETGNILTKAGLTTQGMTKNPQYWLSFAQTYGRDYEEAKEKGADDTTAAFGATITSLLNAGVEIGIDGTSGFQGLPAEVAKGDKNALLEWVKSSVEEGNEEVIQGFISNAVSKVMYDEETELANPKEMAKEWAMGTTVGGIIGGGQIGFMSGANAIKKHQSTKLTENEQAVVDKVVEKEIAEKESNGEKLTAKDKSNLYKNVKNRLERGEIDTDTIEELLGGETFESYTKAQEQEIADLNDLAQLYEGEKMQQQINNYVANSKLGDIRSQLSNEVFELVKDSRLGESYNQRAKRGQAFTADLSQYEEKYQDTIKKAVESGRLNNTTIKEKLSVGDDINGYSNEDFKGQRPTLQEISDNKEIVPQATLNDEVAFSNLKEKQSNGIDADEFMKGLREDYSSGKSVLESSNSGHKLNNISKKEYDKFVFKKPIKVGKKDWAKVDLARTKKYSKYTEEDIPDIDFFRIAEYNQINVAYRYYIRNYDKYSFEIVSKIKIKEEHNNVKTTYSNTDAIGVRHGADGSGSRFIEYGQAVQSNDTMVGRSKESDEGRIVNNGNSAGGRGINEGENYGKEQLHNGGTGGQLTGTNTQSGVGGLPKANGRVFGTGQKNLKGSQGIPNVRDQGNNRGIELSKEQIESLKNTAIKNEDGIPKKVYHFTNNMDFEVFEKGDIGFHFGNELQARQRGKNLKLQGRIITTFLDIKNPIYINTDLMSWRPAHVAIKLYADGIISNEQYLLIREMHIESGYEYNSPAAINLRKILADLGYDGIIYENHYEGDGQSYIAFYQEQVIVIDDGKTYTNQAISGNEVASFNLEDAQSNEIDADEFIKGLRGDEAQEFSQEYIDELLESFGITKPEDYIHVQKRVMETLENEGFFADKENRCTKVVNDASGMVVEINKKGIKETFNLDNYARLGKFKKLAKLATIRKLKTIIKQGKIIADNIQNKYDDESLNKSFGYVEFEMAVDNNKFVVKIAIKKSPQKNKFLVHSIYTKNDVSDSLASTNIGTEASHITANTNVDDQNVMSEKRHRTFNRTINAHSLAQDIFNVNSNYSNQINSDEVIKGIRGKDKGSFTEQQGEVLQSGAETIVDSNNDLKYNEGDLNGDGNKYINEQHKATILRYKSGEAYVINAKLRENETLDESEQYFVNVLNEALQQLPVYEGTVYRNVVFDDFGGEGAYNDFLEQYVPGRLIFYKQFLSCSKEQDGYLVEGEYQVHFVIEGKNARDVDGYGNNMESEVIYPSNSVFVVKKIILKNNIPTIYLQEATANVGHNANEERSNAVRDMQTPHTVHDNLQGISARNTDGDISRGFGSQPTTAVRQWDTVRTRRRQDTVLPTTRKKQKVVNEQKKATSNDEVAFFVEQSNNAAFEISEPDIENIEISNETEFTVGLSGVKYTKMQKHILDVSHSLDSDLAVEFVDGLKTNGAFIRNQNKILLKSDLSVVQMYIEVFKHEFIRMNEILMLQDKIEGGFSKKNVNTTPKTVSDNANIDKYGYNVDNVSRANNRGELINDYYYALNKSEWKMFYDKITKKGYLATAKVGVVAPIIINNKLIIAERQYTSKEVHDYVVIDVYKLFSQDGDNYTLSLLQDALEKGDVDYDTQRIFSFINRLNRIDGRNELLARYDRNNGKFDVAFANGKQKRSISEIYGDSKERIARERLSLRNKSSVQGDNELLDSRVHAFNNYFYTQKMHSKFLNYCFNKSKAFEQYVIAELKLINSNIDIESMAREVVLSLYSEYKYNQYINSKTIPQKERDAFTMEKAQEEIIADFFAQILFQGKQYRERIISALENADGETLIGISDEVSSEAALMELKQKEPTLFGQVVQWIKDIINKLRGMSQAKSLVEQLNNEINQLESMVRKAYQSKDSKRLARDKFSEDVNDDMYDGNSTLDLDDVDNNYIFNYNKDKKVGEKYAEDYQRAVGSFGRERGKANTGRASRNAKENAEIRREDKITFERRIKETYGDARRFVFHLNTTVAYKSADVIDSNSPAGIAYSVLKSNGYNVVCCDGVFELNNGSKTIEVSDAVTLSDGTIYISSEATLNGKGVALHEVVHIWQYANIDEYWEYESVLIEETDHTSKCYEDLAKEINDNHYGGKYDIEDISSSRYIIKELAAYINQYVNTDIEYARQKFSRAFKNFDNVVQAVYELNSKLEFNGVINEATSNDEVAFSMPIENRKNISEESNIKLTFQTNNAKSSVATPKKLNSQEKKHIEEICKKLGCKVIFEDLRGMKYKGAIISPDGYIQNGVIHLNTYAINPIGFVLKHEFTHYSENAAGYKEFANSVTNSAAYANWLKDTTNKKYLWEAEEAYRQMVYESQKDFESLDDAKIDKEIIADFVGEMLFTDNGSGLVAFCAATDVKKRNVVVQFVLDFMKWLKSKLSSQSHLIREISILEDGFRQLLGEVTQTDIKNNYSQESDISFCFVRFNDEAKISQAEKMAKKGVDYTQIYDELGVFKNVFGDWAIALDLKRYSFYPYGNSGTTYNLIQKRNYIEGVLRDVVFWPELYEHFPEFETVRLIIRDSDNPRDTVRFILDDNGGMICVNKKLCDEYSKNHIAKTEMIKAIQNMIQVKEGHYIGKSYEYWKELEEKGKLPYSEKFDRYLTADDMMKYFIDNYDAYMASFRQDLKYAIYKYDNNSKKLEDAILYIPHVNPDYVVAFNKRNKPVILGDKKKKKSAKKEQERNLTEPENILPSSENVRSFILSNETSPLRRQFIEENQLIEGGDSGFLKKRVVNKDPYLHFKNQRDIVCKIAIADTDTLGRKLSTDIQSAMEGSIFVNSKGQPISSYTVSQYDDVFADAQLGIRLGTIDAAVSRYNRESNENASSSKPHCFEFYTIVKNPIYIDGDPYELSVGEIGFHLTGEGVITWNEYNYLLDMKSQKGQMNYKSWAMQRLRKKIKEAGYDGLIFQNDTDDSGSMTVVALDKDQLIPVAKDGILIEENGISHTNYDNDYIGNLITSAQQNSEYLAKYLQEPQYNRRVARKLVDSNMKMGSSDYLENKELGVEELKEKIISNAQKDISGYDNAGRKFTKTAAKQLENCKFKDNEGNIFVFELWNTNPKNISIAVKKGVEFGTVNAAFEKFFEHKENNLKCYNGVFEEFILNCSSPLIVKQNGWNTIEMAEYLLMKKIISKKYYGQVMSVWDIDSPTYSSYAAQALREKIKILGYDCLMFVKDTGDKTVIPFYDEQILPISKNGILNDDCDLFVRFDNEVDDIKDGGAIQPKERTIRDFSAVKDIILSEANNTQRIKNLTEFMSRSNNLLLSDNNTISVGYSGDFEQGENSIWRLNSIYNKHKNLKVLAINDYDTAGRATGEKTADILKNTIFKDENGRPLSFFAWRYNDKTGFENTSLGYRVCTLNEVHDDYINYRNKHPLIKSGQYEEYLVNASDPYVMKNSPKDFTTREFADELYQNGIIDDAEYETIIETKGIDGAGHNRAARRVIKNLKKKGYDSILYMKSSGMMGVIVFDETQLIPVSINGEKIENNGLTLADFKKSAFLLEYIKKMGYKNIENLDEYDIIKLAREYLRSPEGQKDKRPYLRHRPSYAKDQVQLVWQRFIEIFGAVYDPTLVEIHWDPSKPRNGQWDMGHIPGQKYALVHAKYVLGMMTSEEFVQWYRDPNNYRPELPSTNRSHKYE